MATPSLIRIALLAPALVTLASSSTGQSVLYTFKADSPGDRFGWSVGGAGDVNGDGIPDLIVGAIQDDNNGKDSGSARVLSGLDGSVLYTFDGDSPEDYFGWSVSGAGDVNRDGFDDVIVGAPRDDNNGNSGMARVFSGIDGSILHTFYGDDLGSHMLGASVSGAGDVNADGFDDVIVGAPGTAGGRAHVLSGVDGSVLYNFKSAPLEFGRSVSGAGDVDGDGVPDLIVGAPGTGYVEGRAKVFSGADGSLIYTFDGDSVGDEFGWSVSGAGDVNGDGFDDLIVGARFDGNNGPKSGSARVFSGIDHSVLYTFHGDAGGDWFGYSVSGAGDVNGDGYYDLIVGALGDDNNGSASGSARVFSGQDGSVLYTVNGDSKDDELGYSVGGAGDVNGDGFDDVMVGVPQFANPVATYVRVFSGCDALGTSYCGPSVPNSSGDPGVIEACGSNRIADGRSRISLSASHLPTNQFGYFIGSETQGFKANPGGSQGNLCLGGNIARFRKQVQGSGPNGEFTIQVDLTAIPVGPPHSVQPGETWSFQAWFRDNNPTPTSNFTDGVAVTFI